MKRKAILIVFALIIACLISGVSVARSAGLPQDSKPPNDDKTLQDILNEIRLLRADLLRSTSAFHRSQMLLDRIRVEQDQIVELNRQLSETREKIGALNREQAKQRAAVEEAMRKRAVGAISDAAVNEVTAEYDSLDREQQILAEAEKRVNAAINAVQATLLNLNARLDAIDREMGSGDDAKEKKRNQ
jgi:DNA repair exonuclease SbcCD ATPase subunit